MQGENRQQAMEQIMKKIFLVIMIGIYPLFMTNGYYNVTNTKVYLFGLTIILFFPILIGMRYMDEVKEKKGFPIHSLKEVFSGMERTDKSVLAFLLACAISLLFAKEKSVSFTGSTDSHIGFLFMCLLVMTYFLAKREIKVTEELAILISFAGDAVILFAMWQFLGGNPFGWFTNLDTDHVYNYLSTFGNTGVFGQYLTLVIPIAIAGYLGTKKTIYRIIYGISVACGVMGVLCSNTDATYIGYGMILVIFLMVVIANREKLMRLLEIMVIQIGAILLLKVIYHACQNARSLSTIASRILGISGGIVVACTVVLGLLWCIIRYLIKNDKVYFILQWMVRMLCGIAFLTGVGSFFYFSIVDCTTSLGVAENYLRFTKEWGTERGYVWTWLGTIFADFSILQKLVGAGQGSVVLELFSRYYDEMINGLGYYFDNAHNVYLHYLITIGIVGCGAYLLLLFQCLRNGFRGKDFELRKGFAIAVAAYAVQDVVCILQPLTLPLLFLFLALMQRKD